MTIDEAAKDFGRTKQEHEDAMKHLRAEHDELSSQLVQKQRELSDMEKKARIAAVERQLNDRCKGRKRTSSFFSGFSSIFQRFGSYCFTIFVIETMF